MASNTNPQQIPIAEPLVEVRRGPITESRHRGHIAAVEPDGNIACLCWRADTVTFLRSSAKPFQAIACSWSPAPLNILISPTGSRTRLCFT